MKLEQQVCSLQLAAWLKELGVKQNSYFAWCNGVIPRQHIYGSQREAAPSAFTVAELGEMLPPITYSRRKHGYPNGNGKDEWAVSRYPKPRTLHAATEADARAKMLIYLIENKLLTV